MQIDTRQLWRAKFENLIRLAKFLNLPTPPDNCKCPTCQNKLIENILKVINKI